MYEELLKKVKWRRDYFIGIDFTMLGNEYSQMIDAIESLVKQVDDLTTKLESNENIINNEEKDEGEKSC